MTDDHLVVLLAEDNPDDILATKRAWKKQNINNPLFIVRDGEECLDYLKRSGKYTDPASAPRPGLLLLDLNMPKLDGLGVLKHIREDDDLRWLPIVILTTSKADKDLIKSYDLGVNAYIMKPIGFEELASTISKITLFWELVEQPR